MPTDTSEAGLEALIVRDMAAGGWLPGAGTDYHREAAVDLAHLTAFLTATQPAAAEKLDLAVDAITRKKFLARLADELAARGVVDVLRNGVKHNSVSLDLYFARPTPGNDKAAERHARNRWSVSRQVRYSTTDPGRAVDLVLFVNGLPVATAELKNSLTKQTTADAVAQYKRDRSAKEPLFAFGRCAVHFAVDDSTVEMCSELAGPASWFLPFNKGWNDGAGNPPDPTGPKTAYLWRDILAPGSLAEIVEQFAQITEDKDAKTGKVTRRQVFPRFHQLDAVRALLADAAARGVGRRYLVQHSAGSGKSNTIAWLAHQLGGVRHRGEPAFDTVVVVTDRRVLDTQLTNTLKRFMQVAAAVGHADDAAELRRLIEAGKRIVLTTVQKFPFVVDAIGDAHRGRRFAVLIDEAHSSQGGKAAAALNAALTADAGDGPDPEDAVNEALAERMAARKLPANASFFAFTATPKGKTLELFGDELPPDADGKRRFRPFHKYTMKQAIQEGFILDVLRSYTPVDSYYRLVKTAADDPEVDTKKARKKLRTYVEGHDHAVRRKAEIMVDHFREQVLAAKKVGGRARAMVVCNGVERAVQYFAAISAYLAETGGRYKALVAYSGEHDGQTEDARNGFPGRLIADRFKEDESYRFLVCADKFQTGYDEPLLHTMYVDKPLAGIQAVQTLSRLNRAHPAKHDTFVLDFQNHTETIREAFADYYRTTILSDATDENVLHDLAARLDAAQVYTPAQVDELVGLFLAGADRGKLDPILDACVSEYLNLDEDGQVRFKGEAKAFGRLYGFLATVLPHTHAGYEKRSILLAFLVPKLPAPTEEDLSKGVLDAIDMDSYRPEKQAALAVGLPDEDAIVDPAGGGAGRPPDPTLDRLSVVLAGFNDEFGTLFSDADRIARRIADDIAPKVAADPAYRNAKRNTPGAARLELDAALDRATQPLFKDDTEFYKQFVQNEAFKRFVADMVQKLTADPGG